MNLPTFLAPLLAPLLLVASASLARGQDDPAVDPTESRISPVLRAGTVTAASPHHDVKLYFPWSPGIDLTTIGDGDLVARGPNGYHQRAAFVSVERLPHPLPLAELDPTIGELEPEAGPRVLPGPIVVATYRFFPPGAAGDLWTAADNGGYGVRLARGEIATESGRYLPPGFLGAFKVRIPTGPGDPVQPEQVRCQIRRLAVESDLAGDPEVHHLAAVRMFFRSPHVRVDWGTVVLSGNTFTADASAVQGPLPTPSPVSITTADGSPAANAPAILQPSRAHRYRLGVLEPGAWRFVLRVNGIEECVETFVIPPDPPVDDEAPVAGLELRDIHRPGDSPQRFLVTYRDRSGVDISTIGDGDLVIFNPCLFLDVPDPVPCDWRAKRARFVSIVSASSHNRVVKALYEIHAPVGGWSSEHNGFYPVALWEDAVCDRLGNCVERQRLGGFTVRVPVDPPIPAEAEIRIDAGNPDRVAAKVHIDFKEHWQVVDQEIRRVDHRIYLIARAEPLAVPAIFPPPPPPDQDLLYEVGPLREGTYGAIFVMNGHVYDVRRFKVDRSPPIPADVRLTVDASDPDAVVAEVSIQFRTPHRVEQGGIERSGHRIRLKATAHPLPLNADASDLPPVPESVHLRYEIGALPPGGYLALLEMNEFLYAAEEFKVDEPGPPIPAEVGIRIDRSDPDRTVAVVKIRFETPHAIVGRDLHRRDNRFLLEATAAPVLTHDAAGTADAAAPPPSDVVVLRYPLGELEPGDYAAAFVMNGWRYASTTWHEDDPFEAEVELSVDENDAGHWIARAEITFANPQVRITDPGEPVINGHVIMINPAAELLDTTDAPPVPFVLEYDLGELEPGGWWLKYFINDRFEKQLDFIVLPDPPIPAEVAIEVDPGQPVHARVTIQFRDHYRITGQSVHRIGNLFLLDATADGPLPILAPIPPPPVELDYGLGGLDAGKYWAAFRMNGHFYEVVPFTISDGGFEAEVDLEVTTGDETRLKATVDFRNPYVLVTDPGKPVISGNTIRINATAEEVAFIQPPSGDPQCLDYSLGELDPGRYELHFAINGQLEACTVFTVRPPCDPLPHVTDIRVAQGDASWFSQVFVALFPGQRVTDWGEVRRSGNEFHVNITVECVDFAPSPQPQPQVPASALDLPEGMRIDADGDAWLHEVPIRLVSHSYPLGILDPGRYGFLVHSRGTTVARKAFVVPGTAPVVEFSGGTISEPTDEYRFGISYHDPDGLDHESIMSAEVVVVGRDGYREVARLLSYASTDDDPSTSASARYAVSGPGGDWDHEDNGPYRVWVDADAVRDLHGTPIEDGWIGRFRCRIIPPPEPGVNVTVNPTASGSWEATVEIISQPGEQVVVDSWGPLIHHGQVFVALASVHLEPSSGPVEPLAHRYDLGILQPGSYLFVFKTNLAHCGIADFTVPGLEGDPVATWAARAGLDPGDPDEALSRYFFALAPNGGPSPRIRAEIVRGDDGRNHLGLRFRRLHGALGVRQVIEGSTSLGKWIDVSDRIDLMDRQVDLDGTEEVLLCLREALEDSEINFLRIRLVKGDN